MAQICTLAQGNCDAVGRLAEGYGSRLLDLLVKRLWLSVTSGAWRV